MLREVAAMRVTREAVAIHSDERGIVLEPIGFEDLSRQRNVHLVVTLPGFVRGNHVHRSADEMIVVVGPALVRFREGRSIEDVRIGDGEAVRFTFPAGIPHAIQSTGDRPGLLIAFSSAVHDPSDPDVVREVLIEP
ncbi:MAG: hypothetical protein AB9873_06045 [Syntrophobacteraceae bacterium]